MAGTVDAQYKELLNPIKDPEQSFAINISELLQSYIKGFADGRIPPNFNSAALLLQGSCSIYGKRVEYLHNLATKLYSILIKNKNDGTKKDGKEKQTKESKFCDPFCSTEIKMGKNLSCLRKKFSAKNPKKGSKKASDKKFTFVPVDLLPLEGEEKGDVFFDTRGEPVGNKGDYTLNKCRVIDSGWLLLPTVSPELVAPQSSPDYTIVEEQMDDDTCHDSDMPESTPADEGYPPSTGCSTTPGSENTCSQTPGSEDPCSQTPGSEDPCSQTPGSEDPCSQIPYSQGTDEGLGSMPCTPQENDSQPDSITNTPTETPQMELGEDTPSSDSSPPDTPMEGPHDTPMEEPPDTPLEGPPDTPLEGPPDTPMEGIEENAIGDSNHGLEGIENIPIDDADVAPKPRRSMRQALKLCQIKESGVSEEQEGNVPQEEERGVVVMKRAIQKKNTCKIPSKLKTKEQTAVNIFPASEFCARTFFSLDQKFRKNCILSLGVPAFEKNSAMFKKFLHIADVLKATNRAKKKRKRNNEEDVEDVESEEIDVEEMENMLDPDTDIDIETPHLDMVDIVIANNLPSDMAAASENPIAEGDDPLFIGPLLDVNPPGNDNAVDSLDEDDDDIDDHDTYFKQAAILEVNLYKEDLLQYVQTSDIMERFYEWEDIMKPFLKELRKRKKFDINLYGSHILNAFKDTNRRQTITFRNFCKNKEKFQIHRYFMALLPLVNVGNVSIELEKRSDGDEDILVTLLSRKMHHTELEEFGHTSGEHS